MLKGFKLTVVMMVACMCGAIAVAEVHIDTVTVGNPGNSGELSGPGAGGLGTDRMCGRVDYVYQIGTYEVTTGQYTEFLNAVAKTDTYSLWSEQMTSHTQGCQIERTGGQGNYSYAINPGLANRPVTHISWGDAARFCNWLHNGQPAGAQGLSTTEDGSYYLNGAMTDEELNAVGRNNGVATWVIPTEDEWYKAAYHKDNGVTGDYWDFPTGSDTIGHDCANYGGYVGMTTDVGTYPCPSPYGTYDQAGNVWEMTETMPDYGGLRGGAFLAGHDGAVERMLAADRYGHGLRSADGGPHVGFRLVIPEPASMLLLALGGLVAVRRR